MPLKDLLDNNRRWAEDIKQQSPEFFPELAKQQTPEYLWIGCSDSRVPANQIVGLAPGEIFVHRNVANLVNATDLNCLSVVQYAVDALKVKHIIVCGHYGCGGVMSAMDSADTGISANWLTSVRDTYFRHRDEINAIPDAKERVNALCELNVKTQVTHLAHTKIVQGAWQRQQELHVHGWIYGLNDGLLKDLDVSVKGMDDIEDIYKIDLV